jgi:hypothetical protein
MNWKQILFPRYVRNCFKNARLVKNAVFPQWLTLLLALGKPKPVAQYLRGRGLRGRVVLRKQGILSLRAGQQFLRYAASPRAIGKLQSEYFSWCRLREYGLGGIIQRSMKLQALESGTLLETDWLRPIRKEEQAAVTLPIIRALLTTAKPVVHDGLPPTIAAGLRLAQQVYGGVLPDTFVVETEIRKCFSGALMTGVSHGDLHFRNVMRDGDGRPVLIDVKSCAFEQILSLDLITFAGKYLANKNGCNMLDAAFSAQRCGWQLAELDRALAFIDLPRPLWGPILAVHTLGRLALKRTPGQQPNPLIRKLLFRVLSKDWRAR